MSFIKELAGEVDVIACRTFSESHARGFFFFFSQVNQYSSENLGVLHWNLDLGMQFIIVKTVFG